MNTRAAEIVFCLEQPILSIKRKFNEFSFLLRIFIMHTFIYYIEY